MAAAQALGTDGNEGGCTNSWEAALEVAQLGEDRHQGESRGLHGCGKERRRRPRLKKAGAESAGAVSAETGRGHGGVAATLPWRGYAGGGRVAAA